MAFERFTGRAMTVMSLADRCARDWNHEEVGVHHVLIGLIEEDTGVAAHALKRFDLSCRKIRQEVEKLHPASREIVTLRKLPLTAATTGIIAGAVNQAKTLEHDYVGTEHILLALIQVGEGVSCQVLKNLGLTPEGIRKAVLNLLELWEFGEGESRQLLSTEKSVMTIKVGKTGAVPGFLVTLHTSLGAVLRDRELRDRDALHWYLLAIQDVAGGEVIVPEIPADPPTA